jgi:uncharacterized protein (TIGR02996 family)
MREDDPFLQAILADPGNDAPRLIYADWLEERGDPRGEFIRVQCALARLGGDDERRLPLEEREWELLDAYGETWVHSLRKLGITDGEHYLDSVGFHRGLVEEVKVKGSRTFLRRAKGLFAAAPSLRGLTIWGRVSVGAWPLRRTWPV